MGVYLGLVEEDDYADGEPDYEQAPERAPARRDEYADAHHPREAHRGADAPRGHDRGREYDRDFEHDYDRVEQYANGHPAAGDVAGYQITALHPRTYNEARAIGEHFRNHTPVIMDLSDMDDADAKRLVDFAAGLVFGLRGSIDRVTTKVFLLTPRNVTVTAQDKARIENGFFNQS
jgi:cell division inhibitor SepF